MVTQLCCILFACVISCCAFGNGYTALSCAKQKLSWFAHEIDSAIQMQNNYEQQYVNNTH